MTEKVVAYFATFWAQRARETTMRKMQDREEYDAELQARVEAGLPEEERPVRSSCDSISWDHAAFLSDIAVKKKKRILEGTDTAILSLEEEACLWL